MARNRLPIEAGLDGENLNEHVDKPIDPVAAQAAINADKQRRRDVAIAELNELCKRNNVKPIHITQIVNGQVSQGIDFEPQ